MRVLSTATLPATETRPTVIGAEAAALSAGGNAAGDWAAAGVASTRSSANAAGWIGRTRWPAHPPAGRLGLGGSPRR